MHQAHRKKQIIKDRAAFPFTWIRFSPLMDWASFVNLGWWRWLVKENCGWLVLVRKSSGALTFHW